MAHKSSGVAKAGLTTGIIGTSLAAAPALLGEGGLGGILGGGNNGRVSELQSQVAKLQSERYTDQTTLELYRFLTGEFKERDQLITSTLIEEGKQQERINCNVKELERVRGVVEEHSRELCELRAREAVQAERFTALSHTMNTRFDTERRDFYNALHCEKEARIAGDEASINYVNCNTVPNKKVIDASLICPGVVTTQQYANGAINYFNEGGKTPVVYPSSCVCPAA